MNKSSLSFSGIFRTPFFNASGRWPFVFMLYASLFITAGRSNDSVAADIVYPWRATSAIVQAGDGFCLWLYNPENAIIDSVRLIGPFTIIKAGIDSISAARYEYDSFTHASVNNRIWVHVPTFAHMGLYHLAVHCGEETHVSLKSVQVIDHVKPAHSFLHISDLHVSRQWQGSAVQGYAKELELLDRFIRVANIIAPDFILITGDNIHHYTRLSADSTGWGGEKVYAADQPPLVEEKYRNLFEGAAGFAGLYELEVPFFLTTGNHDFYGVASTDHMAKARQWNALCGLRVYGFSYAGTRVVVADDYLGDPKTDIPDRHPMSGLQGQTLKNFFKENGAGYLRIMAQHRPDRIDTVFIDQHKINILLNGHQHDPAAEWVGATPTLSTRPGTVCRSGEIGRWETTLGFFRVFYVSEDSFTFTPPLRFCQNPTAPVNELKLNLTLDFFRPNDGSSWQNKGLLVNNLGVDLPHCRIRFIMKKGTYTIDRGCIEQVIHTDKATIVDVRVPVKANARETVTITDTK